MKGGIVTGGHLLSSRELGSHSMYHQMLIPSASSPPPLPLPLSSFVLPLSSPRSAAAAPPSPLSRAHCSQVEKEPWMEVLSSLVPGTASCQLPPPPPPSQQQQQQNQEAVVWAADKVGVHSDGFSVDELLNLGEFGENEKEQEAEAVAGDPKVEKLETEEHGNAASSSSLSSSSVLSCEGSRPLAEISLPAHDAEELEWVSFIIDDSLSEFPAEVAPAFASLPHVQYRSDDAQHESREQPHGTAVATAPGAGLPCTTVCAVPTEAPLPPKAKRSKRSRTVTGGWSSSLPLTDSSSATTTTSASSSLSASSSSFSSCLIYDQSAVTGEQSFLLYESHPSLQPPPPPPPPLSKKTKLPKKRGRKPKQPPASAGSSGERRCSHCGAQKTPQWRAGPLGAKTLCNACGVRYKSGRLLPEYRPACSPTYVDSIHSSSHRKVLELRRQKEAELLLAVGPPPVATC